MGLREQLSNDYSTKLDLIENKAKDIWENGAVYFPYYTLHGIKHSNAVIEILDRLVIGLNTDDQLEQVEIFCLLSAAYLHDVGMQRKFQDDETKIKSISISKKEPYTFQDLIRDEHHLRSGRYIIENRIALGLDNIESKCIRLISEGHRKVNLFLNDYESQAIGHKRVRVRLLSALLRLADELDIDYRRAPETLYDILENAMPDFSRLQWLKHHYTNGVIIEQILKEGKKALCIDINCQYPEKDKGIVIIEILVLKPINERIEEVEKILLRYGLELELTHKINLNKDLQEIPENLYNNILGKKLIFTNEPTKTDEFSSGNDELSRQLSSLNKNIGDLLAEGKNNELIELLDSLNKSIKEIQEKAKITCKESMGTSTEEIACAVCDEVQRWEINSQEEISQNIEDIVDLLKSKVANLPENTYLLNKIESIKNERDLTKQYRALLFVIEQIPTMKVITEQSVKEKIVGSNEEMLEEIRKVGNQLDDIIIYVKPGLHEELILCIVSIPLLEGGVEYTLTIPLPGVSRSEVYEDLKEISGKRISQLSMLPKKIAKIVKEYLIENKMEDILNKLWNG
jgi:hypothetical protein